ncbi:hypothetical protein GBAR_LOCUS26562 [Geodia barretti]|uniref:Uncharacterized protein n=1 Tax=Geodia barretti TaxID=519541 RepID=A0AA35TGW7_GEOBA|nr:hypothetical protein GBAR_LOCUS26562 [Geodia barretti]
MERYYIRTYILTYSSIPLPFVTPRKCLLLLIFVYSRYRCMLLLEASCYLCRKASLQALRNTFRCPGQRTMTGVVRERSNSMMIMEPLPSGRL